MIQLRFSIGLCHALRAYAFSPCPVSYFPNTHLLFSSLSSLLLVRLRIPTKRQHGPNTSSSLSFALAAAVSSLKVDTVAIWGGHVK